MKRVTVILEVLILVGLVGCGKSKEKTIVGKWKQVDATQTIEFFEDGTVRIIDKGEPPVTGDYRFIDENQIRMDFKGIGELFGAVIAEISPLKDEITLTNPLGKVEKYRRFDEEGKLRLKNKKKTSEGKLSKEGTRLLGKYVAQMDDGSQIFLELKSDGTALISGSSIMGWEVIWCPKDNRPYSPTLMLIFYALDGRSIGLSYHACDGEQAVKIPLNFDSYQVDYWHRRVMDSQDILVRQTGAKLISLGKIKVWDTDESTICPGDVKIWDRYVVKEEDQEAILELKRIPNFAPPGWKRLTGCDGSGIFYSTVTWKTIGRKIQIDAGGDKIEELEIKGDTLIDNKNGITFVKQDDKDTGPESPTEVLNYTQFPLKGDWKPTRVFNVWSSDWCGRHLGEDVERKPETPVYPMTDGIVKFAQYQAKAGIGYGVIIEHNFDGEYLCTVYYHMREPKAGEALKEGQSVTLDKPIGYVSSDLKDHLSIPHLHFGIRKGKYLTGRDPRTNKWYYPGYTAIYNKQGIRESNPDNPIHEEIAKEWYKPSEFINVHSTTLPPKTENKLKTFYDQAEEDKKRFLAEPQQVQEKKPVDHNKTPVESPVKQARPAEPTQLYFKPLSEIDSIEAERLLNVAVPGRNIGRLPMTGFKLMVDNCRKIISKWADSFYAYRAKKMLADIPTQYHEQFKLTKDELDLSRFATPRLGTKPFVIKQVNKKD